MEINEKSYILGYWFANDGKNDWYMIIIKENGEWIGKQTFRYSTSDGDPFSGEDRKSISIVKIDGKVSEKEVIEKIDGLFDIIKLKYNDFDDKFLVKGGIDKFMKIANTKHYFHIKEVH